MSPPPLCRWMRWKTYALDIEHPDELVDALQGRGELCTCLRTTMEVGADDGPVAPERCAPGRACWEPHPRLRVVEVG